MSLFGSLFGTSGYEKALGRMAKLNEGQFRQYVPALNQMLMGIIQNGGKSPIFQAGQRQAEEDTDTYYQQAYANLMRGLGDTNSLQRTNSMLALSRGRAADLSRMRQQNLAQQHAYVQQALQTLLGSATGSGQSAMQGYNSAGNMAMNAAGQFTNLLGTAASLGNTYANIYNATKKED